MGWAGTTLEDRRDARRRRLLDVGLELLGGAGAAAVSVRSVCRHAGLTDRYFYESFADRDQLILAVYDEVAAEARDALIEATAGGNDDAAAAARRAVERFLAVLLDDPRKGRVLLIEPLADPALSRRGRELMPLFADVVAARLGPSGPLSGRQGPSGRHGPTPLAAEMTATALIGALANLFGRWLHGDLEATRAEVTEFGVHLLVALVPPAG